jgi:hypothetical protein
MKKFELTHDHKKQIEEMVKDVYVKPFLSNFRFTHNDFIRCVFQGNSVEVYWYEFVALNLSRQVFKLINLVAFPGSDIDTLDGYIESDLSMYLGNIDETMTGHPVESLYLAYLQAKEDEQTDTREAGFMAH